MTLRTACCFTWQVTPATQALSFIYGQELLVRLGLGRLVGAVDRSVDLSQERFHDEYFDPLELQVQCASLMSVIALAPAFLWVAVRCNEGMPLRALLKRAVYAFFWGTVAALVTVILFGAPVVTAAHKTFAFSMILGGIPAMPLGCTLGSDVRVWQRVLSHNDIRGAAEFQFWIPAAATVVGAWVGAFPIPLDWDRPWQVMWREKVHIYPHVRHETRAPNARPRSERRGERENFSQDVHAYACCT